MGSPARYGFLERMGRGTYGAGGVGRKGLVLAGPFRGPAMGAPQEGRGFLRLALSTAVPARGQHPCALFLRARADHLASCDARPLHLADVAARAPAGDAFAD